jgi:hypothetical protein
MYLLLALLLGIVLGSRLHTTVAEEVSTAPLCRFGVNVQGDPSPLDVGALRMGWYLNYNAWANAPRPNGITYTPVIRLSQVGEDDYAYNPSGAELQAAISGNPGATWYIGNEPDRRYYQDDLLPHLYARAYHELYTLIKAADPSAHVIAGTIVQPTPVRLLYLDMVLDSYRAQFGERLPTDGWSIHNFILNEVSCDYDPGNCWGADIPPGIDWPYGEIVSIDDNDDFDRFVERIVRFRTWMRDRGYAGLPLYLSEYGILMPSEYGFNAARVNAFMNATFSYMRSATHMQLGNPNDEYRLVQRWSWYSAIDTSYNGWLFDPSSYALTAIGANFAAYTAPLADEVDLFPATITSTPIAPFSTGAPVTVTLAASIANGGNLVTTTTGIVARFYDGNPAQGGTQIGSDQVVQLAGCGDSSTVSVVWQNVPPGAHPVYVVVDPAGTIPEENEQNNIKSQLIVVATERALMPTVSH